MREDQTLDTIPKARTATGLGARRRGWVAVVVAVLVVACAGPAGSPTAPASSPTGASPTSAATAGTGYPDRQISIVVPFDAGGPTDTVTRLIAEPMSATLGQQIVVQNVAGAGGTLGAGQVATAAPDGYTVLMHHIGMSTAPTLYADLPYDPLVDFKTIGLVTEVPMTIIGRKSFEPTNMQELIAYVKANKDTVGYAHAGPGAASQLCGLLFMGAIDTKVTEVPYTGTGPAMDDLLGDEPGVDFMCDQTTNTVKRITAGEVKAYAITSPDRNDAIPDVPTTTEGGLPDVQVSVWHGLYVPKDTPDEIVMALSDALKAALKDQNVVTRFAALGTTPVAEDQATPEAHRAKLQSEIELWKPIIEAAGVKVP